MRIQEKTKEKKTLRDRGQKKKKKEKGMRGHTELKDCNK